jgi:Tol biopolymer transport system component
MYPLHLDEVDTWVPQIWSPNGKFILVSADNSSGDIATYILSITSQKLIPLPEGYNYNCDWAPTDNSLLCLSWDGQTNSVFDAQTGTLTKSIALPPSGEVVSWSPDGNYAAIARSESGGGYSLWRIDYPTLENLKQLTPTLHPIDDQSWIVNAVWSPDSASLAFNFGADVYIVETQVKP